MAASATPPLCIICPKPSTSTCSSCRELPYCSKQCQEIDWPIHNLVCKPFLKDFTEDKRPSSISTLVEYTRGIYFPETGDSPVFVWLPFCRQQMSPTFADFGINDEDMVRIQSCFWNKILDRVLDQKLTCFAHCTMVGNKLGVSQATPNNSMCKVDKELSEYWKGPFFVYGTIGGVGGDSGTPRCHDLGLQDFRHVVDMLRVHHYEASPHQKLYTIEAGEKVKGVRLNCVGDYRVSLRPMIDPKDVLKSVCDSESELNTAIAEKLGIPLIIRKVPHALPWRDRYFDLFPCPENRWAGMLDPETALDLTAPAGLSGEALLRHRLKSSKKIGSLIIVRQDGKPLKPLLVQGLLKYALSKTEQPLHESDTLLNQILRSISPEDFVRWYTNFVQTMCKRTSSSFAKLEAKYDIEGIYIV